MKPKPIYGRLDPAAIKWAIQRAAKSWDTVERKQLHHKGSAPERYDRSRSEMVMSHLVGALGEAAVVRHLDLSLPPIEDLNWRGADIAGWQVRATHHQQGHLWCYSSDDPDIPCVLVTIKAGGYWAIRGWQTVPYIQANGYLRGKTWYLSQDHLLAFPEPQLAIL